ncbi:MAG TPA: hypothetical protein DC047_10520 [Blastocatellia bacterium]|nr:hypothetical protein [Blastocatellia bacterium]
MTTQQIILWTCAYLVELVAVIYLTRATVRGVLGALVGGAGAGLLGLGAIVFCERMGWWQVLFAWTAYIMTIFYLGLAVSLTPIDLVTWRLARRFGWRGLAVFTVIDDHRRATALLYRVNVSQVDGVRTGSGSCPRQCRDLSGIVSR